MTQVLRRPAASLIPLLALLLAMLSPAAAYASGTAHCPDHNGHSGKVESAESAGDLVFDAGTEFCAKKQTGATGKIVADGETTLYEYLVATGIDGEPGEGPSYYIVYDTPTPPADVCPNIDGHQETVPDGYELVDGDCVEASTPPSDVCANIDGIQETIPEGMVDDGNGNCVAEQVEECEDYTGKDAVENYSVEAGTATASIKDDACDPVTLTLSSYELPGGDAVPYEDQIHHDNDTQTLQPGETGNFAVDLPECNWQTDLYLGEKLTQLIPNVGHPSDRLLAWDLNEGNTCEDDTTGDGVADYDRNDNVPICHATSSATNPYVTNSPSVNSIVGGNGHGGHDGPIFDPTTMSSGDDWGDIIPAFTYLGKDGELQSYPGLNWPAGEEIYDAGCVFPGTTVPAPAISLDKSAPESVTLADEDDTVEVTYTYVITNTGNVTLDITEFGDDRIAALDLDAVEDTTLEPGADTTVTWTATLGYDDFDEDGNHTNVATVTGVIEGGDVTDTDDTVTADDDHTVTVEIDDDGAVGGDGTLDLDITATAGEICLGDEVVITVVNGSEVDVTITGLLTLPGGGTMPVVYQVDAESTTTFTDTPVVEGTHTIEWYAFAADHDAVAGTLVFEVAVCEDDTEPTEPPVVVPDIEVGDEDDVVEIDLEALYAQVCIGADVLLSLTSAGAEGALSVTFGGDDLGLLDGLDLTDITLGDDAPFTFLLEDLAEGDYTLPFTVTDGDGFTFEDAFVIEVVDCDDVTIPGPGDGDDGDNGDDVAPMVSVDYRLVCPDGVAGLVVSATGTDLDVATGQVNVAFVGDAMPFWTFDVTLDESLALLWPIDDDGLLLGQFDIWVSIDGVDSDVVTLDTDAFVDCDEVLGEVIDQPDADDESTPDDGETVDGDEVVREDDRVVASDDEDQVLGVVVDADSDDGAVSGEALAYTGGSVLALLVAGLFSLLSGAGLLRRRS
jgi:hypothetical protein